MQEKYLEEEHIMFRDMVKEFVKKDLAPYEHQWEKDGVVSREAWLKAGELGILGIDIPEEYGGLGLNDHRYNTIIMEEMARANISGPGFGSQNEIWLLENGSVH